ncbi:hypothetical protein C8R44DRAFT_750584 [Mycena epipterygia]|nr:hypothetical protein C8R44DRAFT_750584 [Mycena epipterygia]
MTLPANFDGGPTASTLPGIIILTFFIFLLWSLTVRSPLPAVERKIGKFGLVKIYVHSRRANAPARNIAKLDVDPTTQRRSLDDAPEVRRASGTEDNSGGGGVGAASRAASSGRHHTVIEAVMLMFKTHELKCVGSLPHTPIVALIEAVGRTLVAELKQFLPSILPLLLKVLAVEGELSDKRMGTQMKIFDAFQTFGANIEEYLHLVVPIILGSDFVIFVPTISKVGYDRVVTALLNGERLTLEPNAFLMSDPKLTEFALAEAAKLTVNQIHLKQAWDTAKINTWQDWLDWIHRLGCGPSHLFAVRVLRAEFRTIWCARSKSRSIHPLPRPRLLDLCEFMEPIEIALTSPITPSEVIRRLLDLCEFMEHEERPLPIDHSTLGEYSMKFLPYAKVLHYKELELFSNASPTILESLISINTRLQQHDAVWGALLTMREQYDVTNTEEWRVRREGGGGSGDPDRAHTLLACTGRMGAAGIRGGRAVAAREPRGPAGDCADGGGGGAVAQRFSKALTHISKARELLHPEFDGVGGAGYARSYNVMVHAELEEVILYSQ